MPEQYVQTRINLLTALREIERNGNQVIVDIHEITAEDNASTTAEKYGVENQNGITPPLFVQEDGRFMPWQKDLYLGLVFKGSGGQQTIPFVYKGLPVEYEIMRTLSSVSGSKAKKKLGIFATDAPMMGSAGMGIMGFSMGGGTPAWEVVSELRKQYDVQEVTGGEIKKGDYDAIMVVQPSTLDNEKLDDLIAAIKAGVPTAIFEDPLPLIQGSVTGTYEPRRNNQQGGGPGQPPPPAPEKGDLSKLWSLLGVHFNVNPTERLEAIKNELLQLQTSANRSLAPARGRFTEVGSFFTKLNDLIKKTSEYEARLNANAPLSSSDWSSLSLTSLRDSINGLDSGHPIRNFIEQKLLDPVDTKLKGLEKPLVGQTFFATPIKSGYSIDLNILFDPASSAINKNKYGENLDQVFQLLKSRSDLSIIIAGHTDKVGRESYNKDLSLKRAEAVKKYFVNLGINAKRIETKGFGWSIPAYPYINGENENALNRRITLKIK